MDLIIWAERLENVADMYIFKHLHHFCPKVPEQKRSDKMDLILNDISGDLSLFLKET